MTHHAQDADASIPQDATVSHPETAGHPGILHIETAEQGAEAFGCSVEEFRHFSDGIRIAALEHKLANFWNEAYTRDGEEMVPIVPDPEEEKRLKAELQQLKAEVRENRLLAEARERLRNRAWMKHKGHRKAVAPRRPGPRK